MSDGSPLAAKSHFGRIPTEIPLATPKTLLLSICRRSALQTGVGHPVAADQSRCGINGKPCFFAASRSSLPQHANSSSSPA